MLSLLPAIFTVCVFLVQFSSGAVIRRHGWQHDFVSLGPWSADHGHHTKTTDVQSVTATGAALPESTAVDDDACEDEDEDEDESGSGDDSSDDSASTSVSGITVILSTSISATTSAAIATSSASSLRSKTTLSTASLTIVLSTSSTIPTSTQEVETVQSTMTVIPLQSSSSTTTSTISKPSTTSTSSTLIPTTTSQAPSQISSSTLWRPTAGATWQIQISGTVDTTLPASIYDVDLFDTPATTITTLQASGKKVICYFSAGSYEDWRSDAPSFVASDKGSSLSGWAGEWWLNTNSANVRSIMSTRLALAASKGCNAVDPDNVDGYSNSNGLGLTEDNAINYLQFLSTTAHSLGLSIGLKNAGGLLDKVLDIMEFGVNESCLEYSECAVSQPFIDAGKPVFHIEYPESAPDVSASVKSSTCNVSGASGFSTLLKTSDLGAWVDAC